MAALHPVEGKPQRLYQVLRVGEADVGQLTTSQALQQAPGRGSLDLDPVAPPVRARSDDRRGQLILGLPNAAIFASLIAGPSGNGRPGN